MPRAALLLLSLITATSIIAGTAQVECIHRYNGDPLIKLRICGATPAQRDRFADFSIAFLTHVNANFITLGDSLESELTITLHRDSAAFQARLRQQRPGVPPPQYAWYDVSTRRIHTPVDINPGYLAHELLHPVVEARLPARARWAAEGIPLFFEQFTATRHCDNWSWQDFGTHNPDRIRALGDGIRGINLRFTLAQRQMRYHNAQSEVRMLVIFLWEQGRFHEFLRRVRADERGGFDTHFEAALGRDLDAVESDWRRWLQRVHERRTMLSRQPPARIIVN